MAMDIKFQDVALFTAGVVVGVGAAAFLRTEAGRKAAILAASKGFELKDRAMTLLERTKEAVEDIVAEAKCGGGVGGGNAPFQDA